VNVPGVTGLQVPAGANWQGDPQASCIVDANGTDYFEPWVYTNNGTNLAGVAWFMAFPISGVVGPPGPPGVVGTTWRQLQRTVVSSPQASVDIINIPSDVNEIEVSFDLLPVAALNDLVAQFYGATGVLDTTAGHYAFSVFGSSNAATAGATVTAQGNAAATYTSGILLDYSATGGFIANTVGSGIKGSFKVINIKAATRKALIGGSVYINNSGNLGCYTTIGDRNVLEAITGLRLSFPQGNIASGSFEVWGSP
jgi:hypothetical protein